MVGEGRVSGVDADAHCDDIGVDANSETEIELDSHATADDSDEDTIR